MKTRTCKMLRITKMASVDASTRLRVVPGSMLAASAAAVTVLSGQALGQAAASFVPVPMPVATVAVGFVYLNARTGERVISASNLRPRDASNIGYLVDNFDQCGTGQAFFVPQRIPGLVNLNDRYLDWGETEYNCVVDCIQFGYATNEYDPSLSGVPGLDISIAFFEPVDLAFAGLCPIQWLELTFPDLPGSDDGLAIRAWVVTVDFCDPGFPTPEFMFEVGDSDGIDQSANGLNSGTGPNVDLDGNGRADFGFGISFSAPTPNSITGSLLVLPAGGATNLYDNEDRLARYSSSFDCADFQGLIDFGGHACGTTPDRPWASLVLGLYGDQPAHRGQRGSATCPEAPCRPCTCIADWDCSGNIDFYDVLAFMNDFQASTVCADLNTDLMWNFDDFAIFLNSWNAGCP